VGVATRVGVAARVGVATRVVKTAQAGNATSALKTSPPPTPVVPPPIPSYEARTMSKAHIVQLLITIAGIALAMMAFLLGPFELFGNAVMAVGIFFVAGAAAGYAYAKLATMEQKIRDLRDRVDNPPA
jgi:hypothetical protein